MNNNLGAWKYIICSGENSIKNNFELYEKIYNCWHQVWAQAYQDLGLTKTLFSDAFTRQNHIGALFYENECLALCFFRQGNASHGNFFLDSYFANWSNEHRKLLSSRGEEIIVCSNLTIHPKGRGLKTGISLKDLLVGISIETFLNSSADAMTGALRQDRNVHEACARWGGFEIAPNIDSGYGDKVYLMGFFKDHISKQPTPILKSAVKKLWEDRLDLTQESNNKNIIKKVS